VVEVEDAVGRLGSVDTAQEFDVSVGIGWRADCSRGSDSLIFGLGSKEDGMGKLDLLLRRGSMGIIACSRRESRRSGRRVGGCSCNCTI
jgi:hypothetical protein